MRNRAGSFEDLEAVMCNLKSENQELKVTEALGSLSARLDNGRMGNVERAKLPSTQTQHKFGFKAWNLNFSRLGIGLLTLIWQSQFSSYLEFRQIRLWFGED